jgi:hypothetical protein
MTKLCHGSSEWVTHLHQILALIALFAISESLSPNPPTFFGLQIVPQSTSAHLCFNSELPHKKFLWIALIRLRIDLGADRREKR